MHTYYGLVMHASEGGRPDTPSVFCHLQSYARIATLPLEYGLYSSFVGVMIYAVFSTSAQVTIGPVAVMSLEVARVIHQVQSSPGGAQYSAPEIGTALAFLCGIIVLGIGLLRIGWLIEVRRGRFNIPTVHADCPLPPQFIPSPSIAGFMTGSALNIAVGQWPSLMGYSSKLNTRASTYKVIIDSLKLLPQTKLDAAFGLTGLAFLYIVRYALQRVERKSRNPVVKKIAFFALTLRTAFVIIILTVASYAFLRNKDPKNYPISVLKDVPSGFQHMGQPKLPTELLSKIAPQLPVSTIILLLEHIAIAKSFGRIYNYKIDPNQELIAIGVSNLIGTLFGAYPATGSFSRSAIKVRGSARISSALDERKHSLLPSPLFSCRRKQVSRRSTDVPETSNRLADNVRWSQAFVLRSPAGSPVFVSLSHSTL